MKLHNFNVDTKDDNSWNLFLEALSILREHMR